MNVEKTNEIHEWSEPKSDCLFIFFCCIDAVFNCQNGLRNGKKT